MFETSEEQKITPREILRAAWESIEEIASDEVTERIEAILNGTHKTYKYILVNGILAKASYPKINPLALQAGSKLEGAYDARSLCHSVLVPFEREFMANALGGSNEPFLNKPARFTELSLENAVRNGNDRRTLEMLIDVLSNIDNRTATPYLIFALSLLKKRKEYLDNLQTLKIETQLQLSDVLSFIKEFLSNSYEGESSVIVIGAVEKMFHRYESEDVLVEVHKVNQSGASSKEVGDIDIYVNEVLDYCIEVKDKQFNSSDLNHAFKKMMLAGVKKGYFIYGLNGKAEQVVIDEVEKEFNGKLYCVVVDIMTYVKIVLEKSKIEDSNIFFEKIMKTAVEINCKEEVKLKIQELVAGINKKNLSVNA